MFGRDNVLSLKAVKDQNDASSVHMLEYCSLKRAGLVLVNCGALRRLINLKHSKHTQERICV